MIENIVIFVVALVLSQIVFHWLTLEDPAITAERELCLRRLRDEKEKVT